MLISSANASFGRFFGGVVNAVGDVANAVGDGAKVLIKPDIKSYRSVNIKSLPSANSPETRILRFLGGSQGILGYCC